MKRKRVRFNSELQRVLETSGGDLEQAVRDEHEDAIGNDESLSLNPIENIPTTAALSLGRPEGAHLSEEENYQLQLIIDAFENGALNTLSQMQRACFTEVMISGDTYDTVAARYRITRGAVQTHIKRAAAHIRRAIGTLDD